MTHIDGLRPVLEWEPPYDWKHPSRLKEKTIREALEFNHSQLGPQLTALVPACTDVERGRVHGAQEWVLPSILACLPRARACALLPTLHADLDESRISLMVDQVKQVGVALWQLIRDSKQSGK